MNSAKIALEELSMDPAAQRLADERKTADRIHRHLMASSREEGREEGREEALEQFRAAAKSICLTLGVDLVPNGRGNFQHLASMNWLNSSRP